MDPGEQKYAMLCIGKTETTHTHNILLTQTLYFYLDMPYN